MNTPLEQLKKKVRSCWRGSEMDAVAEEIYSLGKKDAVEEIKENGRKLTEYKEPRWMVEEAVLQAAVGDEEKKEGCDNCL